MRQLRNRIFQAFGAIGIYVAAVASIEAQTPYPTLFGGGSGDPAFANGRPVRVAIGGGVAIPGGRFKDRHDLGFHADLAVLLGKRGLPVRLRPEVSFATFRVSQRIAPVRNLDDLSNTQFLIGSGNLELSLFRGLYGLVGAGRMNITSKVPTDSLPDAKGSSTLFNAGAGYRFAFARIAGYLEARVTASSIDQTKFGYSNVQIMPLSFGFVF